MKRPVLFSFVIPEYIMKRPVLFSFVIPEYIIKRPVLFFFLVSPALKPYIRFTAFWK
jgi:hypothetical protein